MEFGLGKRRSAWFAVGPTRFGLEAGDDAGAVEGIFEIENPRLGGARGGQRLAWLAQGIAPEHSEYRSDRFVAAYNRLGRDASVLTAHYIVRAVSPGQYVHPPATVEDMYRPELFARTATGTLRIAGSSVSFGGRTRPRPRA